MKQLFTDEAQVPASSNIDAPRIAPYACVVSFEVASLPTLSELDIFAPDFSQDVSWREVLFEQDHGPPCLKHASSLGYPMAPEFLLDKEGRHE